MTASGRPLARWPAREALNLVYSDARRNAEQEDAFEKKKHRKIHVRQFEETLNASLDEWREWDKERREQEQASIPEQLRRMGGDVG